MTLADKLLSVDQGVILFTGIFIGLTLGSLITFMVIHGMFKDKDD